MTTAKEKYYELKKQTDKYFEGLRDPIHDYVTELEQEKAELVEFVRDIAYNDINKNDLDIDWVQKESWELLNKYTDEPDAL